MKTFGSVEDALKSLEESRKSQRDDLLSIIPEGFEGDPVEYLVDRNLPESSPPFTLSFKKDATFKEKPDHDDAGKYEVVYRMIESDYYLSEVQELEGIKTFGFENQTYWFENLETDYDPIVQIIDRKLRINKQILTKLKAYLDTEKFDSEDYLGETECELLNHLGNALTETLLNHVANNPTKLWVMQQFQAVMTIVKDEDSAVRDSFCQEVIHRLMNIFHIRTSNGLIAYY